jgi:hypothetical protein
VSAAPTKKQRERLDRLHRLPCIACVQEGVSQPFPTEAHHLVDFGYREHSGGHDATIPLCCWHHRGQQLTGANPKMMATMYGPSLALEKRAFTTRYGTQRELLQRVEMVLGLYGVGVAS